MSVRLPATLGALLAALVLAPSAHAALLKGTVSGAPYVASSTTTAVPVIFSSATAKRFGLRSQVGVVVVPRRGSIATPEGAIQPFGLRLGDRFRFNTTLSSAARKASYARLTIKKLEIYRRSKTLSTAELEAALAQTRRDLAALQTFTQSLAQFTASEIGRLRTDVDGLTAGLGAVRADITALRGGIDGLAAQLKATREALEARIGKVEGDLAGLLGRIVALEQQLAAVQTALRALQDQLATLTGTVKTLTDALSGLTGRVAALEALLLGLQTGQLQTTITTVLGLTTKLQELTTLVTQLGAVDVSTLLTRIDGLEDRLDELTADIATRLSALTARVGAAETALGALRTDHDELEAEVARIAAVLAAQGLDITALKAAMAAATGDITKLRTDLTALGGRVTALEVPGVVVPTVSVASFEALVAEVDALEALVGDAATKAELAAVGALAQDALDQLAALELPAQAEVDALEAAVAALTTRIGTAEGAITTTKASLKTTQDELAALTARVAALELPKIP